MAYTVKQLAGMSGVSVRTLHFYDETGLLKPAFVGANGYRYYEEAQLLTLQQILFYRELGFELKQIKHALERAEFERVAALQSHREVLQENLARAQTLIDTIDRTIRHLKGEEEMKSEEMFAGFTVAAGKARFDEQIRLGGEPNDCKVSGRDTSGAMCIFEFTGSGGGPLHVHIGQDEWIYILSGEVEFQGGEERRHASAGESIFVPRGTAHGWAASGGGPARILNAYQPAGRMEEFFRELGKYQGKPEVHEVLTVDQLGQLFQAHGMDLAGPPIVGEWTINETGHGVRTA